MREIVQNAIDALSTLRDHLDEYDLTSKALPVAKAQFESLVKQHDEVEAKLKDKTLLLDKAQHAELKNHNDAIFAATEKNKTIAAQTAALEKDHDEAKTRLSDIQTLHKQVEASLQVLRQKLG